jgi:membrane protease YdiL (CAAX protease family)
VNEENLSPENESTPAPEPAPVPAPQFLTEEKVELPDPFWGWHDVFLFIFITCAALGGAMLAAVTVRTLLHLSTVRMGVVFVIVQFAAYGVAFTCLRWMFKAEYDEPLARSLHWLPVAFHPWTLASIGLIQAFLIALAGALLRTPQTESPMTQLMADRPTAIVIALVGVSLGPIAEELAFRGLLQPLLIKTAGLVPGILGTAVLFGAMHLSQYGFTWQSFLLITVAGIGFGVMRQWSGSTRASAIMHAGYNSALFILFFAGKGQQQ